MENITLFSSLVNINYSDYYNTNRSVTENVSGTNFLGICINGILSLACLLGTMGNGLVIWFGIFRMKKTVNVVWFLSLAVADFSYAFFIPLEITQLILGYWQFGSFMCKFIHFVLSLSMIVSVLQLTVISVDRCICVLFPVWCHNYRIPRLAFLVAPIIWMVSLALAIPSVISANVNNREICVLDDTDIPLETLLGFIFFFLLPLIIIVSCHIMIALHVKRKRPFRSSKSFKTIVAVNIAFFISWFPYHLFSLLFVFVVFIKTYHIAVYYGYLITLFLIIVNTSIKPILYVFIGRDFEEKFCGSFQATFEKAFTEDEGRADFEIQERCIALPRLPKKS
ncbi:chemerin-like receptor 1 [Rhinoderma darwinii]|uniref:chemerin-like receptor 1 n=1 Tax=Rhinoderma darwinii TaxID=43563 RepID=UPI003F67C812